MLAIAAAGAIVAPSFLQKRLRPNRIFRCQPGAFRRGCGVVFMQTHLLEEAAKVIDCTQVLVNMISKRVRELANGHRPLVEVVPRMGLADIALTEVIER